MTNNLLAHDLKIPLTNILVGCEYLKEHLDQSEESYQFIQIVDRNANELKNMIDEMVLMAAIETGDVCLRPIDMHELIFSTLAQVAGLVEKQNAKIEVPPKWPSVLGHSLLVKHVWLNYITNALKYGGNHPVIQMGFTPAADGMVTFWVRDHGPGMTLEEQTDLFTPLERRHRGNIEGHGLGLWIVSQIIQKLKGVVSVSSIPGEGSMFAFSLPTHPPSTSTNPNGLVDVFKVQS